MNRSWSLIFHGSFIKSLFTEWNIFTANDSSGTSPWRSICSGLAFPFPGRRPCCGTTIPRVLPARVLPETDLDKPDAAKPELRRHCPSSDTISRVKFPSGASRVEQRTKKPSRSRLVWIIRSVCRNEMGINKSRTLQTVLEPSATDQRTLVEHFHRSRTITQETPVIAISPNSV